MDDLAPYILEYGRCRVCGCTEATPCSIDGQFACWWVDEQHTLCNNPRCLAVVPLDELTPIEW